MSADVVKDTQRLGHAITDWNSVISRAAGLEVAPVVLSNLRLHLSTVLPADARHVAASEETAVRAEALRKTLVLVGLVNKLDKAGIDVIVLKGPSVAVAAYGDVSLRSFSDIDLLVLRKDVDRARSLFVDSGYRPDFLPAAEKELIKSRRALEFSGPTLKVELHTALLERYLRFEIPWQEMWERSTRVECAGSTIRVLGRAHEFVFLCAHAAKHEWERIRWIADLAQLSEQLDSKLVTEIISVAEATRARRIVALALRMVAEVLGSTDLPERLMSLASRVDTDPCVTMALERLGLVGEEPKVTRFLRTVHPVLQPLRFWMSARERFADRVLGMTQLAVGSIRR